MSDFLDCCGAEPLRAERDALGSALTNAIRQRDDARLEAGRLHAELARLARERDDALAEIRRLGTPRVGRDPLATIVRIVAAR